MRLAPFAVGFAAVVAAGCQGAGSGGGGGAPRGSFDPVFNGNLVAAQFLAPVKGATTPTIENPPSDDKGKPEGKPDGEGAVVAVMDGDFNFGHPDLQHAKDKRSVHIEACDATYPNECTPPPVSNEDVFGGHGTSVAGVIAASADNIHSRGIAPKAKIIALSVDLSTAGSAVSALARDYREWRTTLRSGPTKAMTDRANTWLTGVAGSASDMEASIDYIVDKILSTENPPVAINMSFGANTATGWKDFLERYKYNVATEARVFPFLTDTEGMIFETFVSQYKSEWDRVYARVGGDSQYAKGATAFERLEEKGVVSVVSLGNDAASGPNSFPALLADDVKYPKLAGSVIVVGSARPHPTLAGRYVAASYSNYCGSARRYCLFALGGDYPRSSYGIPLLNSGFLRGRSVYRGTGTSFAAPMVTGAIALLKGTWRQLDGVTAARILLDTANDESHMDVMDAEDDTPRIFRGRYDPETGGVERLGDEVSFEDAFGQGLLDVDAAFARQDDPRTAIFPMGSTIRSGSSTLSSSVFVSPYSMGDSLSGSGLRTIVLDGYGRDWDVDVSSLFRVSDVGLRSSLGVGSSVEGFSSRFSLGGLGLSGAVGEIEGFRVVGGDVSGFDLGFRSEKFSGSFRFGDDLDDGSGFMGGSFPLTGFSWSPELSLVGGGFEASVDRWMSSSFRMGYSWRRSSVSDSESSSARLSWSSESSLISGSWTRLFEGSSFWGGRGSDSSVTSLSGRSDFFTLSFDRRMSSRFRGSASVTWASGEALGSGGFVRGASGVRAMSSVFGLEHLGGFGCLVDSESDDCFVSRLGIAASLPMRSSSGRVHLDLPVGVGSDGTIRRRVYDVSSRPSGREVSYHGYWERRLGLGSSFRIDVGVRTSPSHVSGSSSEGLVSGSFRFLLP